MQTIRIKTNRREEIIDITQLIQNYINQNKLNSGIILVYSPHTTAAISVNENADPSVKSDINNYLSKLIPRNSNFSHAEGNADAHIKGSLVNFSQMFIVEDGKIQLGTWQGIFLMEFDGPRNREIWIKFIKDI